MTGTIIQNIQYDNNDTQWMGYTFIMSDPEKNIQLKISSEKNCCEKFGVFTDANMLDFIGAEYEEISVGDIIKMEGEDCNNSLQITIKITTNKGAINILFYNIHNGFYKHDIKISYYHKNYYIKL